MNRNIQNFKAIDLNIDVSGLPTPIYIVDERLLEKNLKILKMLSTGQTHSSAQRP